MRLPDGIEHNGELPIVALLQIVDLVGKAAMRLEHAAQHDEGAHDLDVHADGELAAQHAGQHDDAQLCEGIWRASPAAADRRLRSQFVTAKTAFHYGETKHEVGGKPFAITFHGLVQRLDADPIQASAGPRRA